MEVIAFLAVSALCLAGSIAMLTGGFGLAMTILGIVLLVIGAVILLYSLYFMILIAACGDTVVTRYSHRRLSWDVMDRALGRGVDTETSRPHLPW